MRKKVTLFANSTVIIMAVLIVVSLFSLSAIFAASGSTVLAPRVDVEATARAIQFSNHREALETASQARMAKKQAEIEQVRQTLSTLDALIQTQTAQYNETRLQLQTQVKQEQDAIKQLEASIIQLQQRIQAAQASSVQDLTALESQLSIVKSELQQQIETVSAELATIEAKMNLEPELPLDTIPSSGSSDEPTFDRDDDGDRDDQNDDDKDSGNVSSDDDGHHDDDNDKSDDQKESDDEKDDKGEDKEDS